MIGWAIEALVATTLLMLLVLAIRGPVRQAFGPHIAYALWSMPVIRLFLPSLPGDWGLTRAIAPLTQRAAAAPGMVMGVLNPDRLPADIDPSVVTRIDVQVAVEVSEALIQRAFESDPAGDERFIAKARELVRHVLQAHSAS